MLNDAASERENLEQQLSTQSNYNFELKLLLQDELGFQLHVM